MKKKATYFLLTFLLAVLQYNCKHNSNRNPFLDNVSFSFDINLDLPQYNTLKYPGNALYIARGGLRGVFVYNTGSGYNVFEASDPNHYPSDCSTMELSGLQVRCPCEGNTYSLSDGGPVQGNVTYPLKPYRSRLNGNILTIYN